MYQGKISDNSYQFGYCNDLSHSLSGPLLILRKTRWFSWYVCEKTTSGFLLTSSPCPPAWSRPTSPPPQPSHLCNQQTLTQIALCAIIARDHNPLYKGGPAIGPPITLFMWLLCKYMSTDLILLLKALQEKKHGREIYVIHALLCILAQNIVTP